MYRESFSNLFFTKTNLYIYLFFIY